jgi:MYXO-CTERM domain-containing protein
MDGECYERCHSGEFPCPGGYTCEEGVCVPSPCLGVDCDNGEVCQDGECVDLNDTAGTAGASSTGSGTGTTGEAGSSSQRGSSDGEAGTEATGDSGTGDSSSTNEEPAHRGEFGLATGSGGCACSVGRDSKRYDLLGAIGLLLAGFAGRRRRRLHGIKEVSR